MTLLNLKTFINNTVKKGGLYYYNHSEYNIFTNGEIAYGVRKDLFVERPDQYLIELLNAYTLKIKSSNNLNEIIDIFINGKRTHVTNYKDSFINNSKTVNVFTDMWNNHNYVTIDRRYKKCCKSTNKCVKDCFIIDTTIKGKELSLYFESILDDNEFILIMPIEIRKD